MRIKYKTIHDTVSAKFDSKVEEFTKDHPDYAIQYKPVGALNGKVRYTAFISYHSEEEGEDGNN